MSGEYYLKTTGRQRLGQPRISVPDSASWDECSASYLCTGDTGGSGGFTYDDAFPDVPGFLIKSIETDPVVSGIYLTAIKGQGAKAPRLYTRITPTAQIYNAADVKISGVPGPGAGGAWPSAEIYLPGIGMEVTYVGAPALSVATATAAIAKPVATPLVIPGFPPVAFPAAPENPWDYIPAATAKLLHPSGWIVARADGPPLKSGLATSEHLLTIAYLHRWKLIPGS